MPAPATETSRRPEGGPAAARVSAPAGVRSPALARVGGGLALAGLALHFMIGGIDLGLGTLFRPGTGAFPFFTGLVLVLLAIGIVVEDMAGDGLQDTPDWISFLAISGALCAFAALADRAGLVPATFAATLVAALPERDLGPGRKLALAVAVALGSWLLFIEGLGLPLKAFRGV